MSWASSWSFGSPHPGVMGVQFHTHVTERIHHGRMVGVGFGQKGHRVMNVKASWKSLNGIPAQVGCHVLSTSLVVSTKVTQKGAAEPRLCILLRLNVSGFRRALRRRCGHPSRSTSRSRTSLWRHFPQTTTARAFFCLTDEAVALEPIRHVANQRRTMSTLLQGRSSFRLRAIQVAQKLTHLSLVDHRALAKGVDVESTPPGVWLSGAANS